MRTQLGTRSPAPRPVPATRSPTGSSEKPPWLPPLSQKTPAPPAAPTAVFPAPPLSALPLLSPASPPSPVSFCTGHTRLLQAQAQMVSGASPSLEPALGQDLHLSWAPMEPQGRTPCPLLSLHLGLPGPLPDSSCPGALPGGQALEMGQELARPLEEVPCCISW